MEYVNGCKVEYGKGWMTISRQWPPPQHRRPHPLEAELHPVLIGIVIAAVLIILGALAYAFLVLLP